MVNEWGLKKCVIFSEKRIIKKYLDSQYNFLSSDFSDGDIVNTSVHSSVTLSPKPQGGI